jgi:hypothetical protein
VDGRKKERKKREEEEEEEEEGTELEESQRLNRLVVPSFSPQFNNGEFPSSSSLGPGMDITYHIQFWFLVSRIAIAIAIANSPWMTAAYGEEDQAQITSLANSFWQLTRRLF